MATEETKSRVDDHTLILEGGKEKTIIVKIAASLVMPHSSLEKNLTAMETVKQE